MNIRFRGAASSRSLGAAILTSVCVLSATHLACGGDGPGGSPQLRLELPPYVGVACELPNSVACDRVGVAVRLRPEEPAQRVEAWLNGRSVEMSGRRVSMREEGGGRSTWPAERTWVFEGFIDDAGLDRGSLAVRRRPDGRWLGEPPVHVRLRVVAHYDDRPPAQRVVRVRLGAGWG